MKLSLGKCWGLLIFDIIGLAISGYAFLLVYQVMTTLPNASAFIILMGFFVGIKVIVLSLYDLNRNMLLKNIPILGGCISLIGNGIIFAVSWFLIPGISIWFFIGLAVSDLLMVTLCHFLWWILIGKDDEAVKDDEVVQVKKEVKKKDAKKETEKGVEKGAKKRAASKKTWLANADEEDSEYDSIFSALLENEKKGQPKHMEKPKTSVDFLENRRFS